MKDKPQYDKIEYNGIICPKCGKEMFDPYPDLLLLTCPPQKNTACECGFKSYREVGRLNFTRENF
jgi:hypothetical protein